MLLSPINLLISEFHFTVMQWQQIDVQESVHIYRLLMFFCSLQPTGIIFFNILVAITFVIAKVSYGLISESPQLLFQINFIICTL